MYKKLAKIKYLPNNFQILKMEIMLSVRFLVSLLSLMNYSIGMLIFRRHTIVMSKLQKKEKKIKLFPPIMRPNPFFWIAFNRVFKPKIQFLSNFF